MAKKVKKTKKESKPALKFGTPEWRKKYAKGSAKKKVAKKRKK